MGLTAVKIGTLLEPSTDADEHTSAVTLRARDPAGIATIEALRGAASRQSLTTCCRPRLLRQVPRQPQGPEEHPREQQQVADPPPGGRSEHRDENADEHDLGRGGGEID